MRLPRNPFTRRPRPGGELEPGTRVCYCADRAAVPFAGHYATRIVDGHEVPDPSRPLRWIPDPGDPSQGRYVHA